VEKRLKTELRVGLFFNLGIALILLTLFLFGGPSHFFSKKLHYFFSEEDAQGIVQGAKVLIAGINAGKVDQVQLDRQTSKVMVEIEIEPRFLSYIRQGSYVHLETQGVLGDKIVIVQPGGAEKPELPDQAVLPLRESVSINSLLSQGSQFMQHLDQLTVGVNNLIEGLGTKSHGKQVGTYATNTLRNLSELTGRFKDFDVAKLDSTINNLNSILEKIDSGSGSLGALINDPSLYDDAKALVGEANGNRIIRNFVRLSVNDAKKKNSEQSGG
jgi:phospholipid/cholesterol/gamma-HCH transport system substrate-binding protein